jgi:hypothetical protein
MPIREAVGENLPWRMSCLLSLKPWKRDVGFERRICGGKLSEVNFSAKDTLVGDEQTVKRGHELLILQVYFIRPVSTVRGPINYLPGPAPSGRSRLDQSESSPITLGGITRGGEID